MTSDQTHTAALAAGATVLGEGPFHYLFSANQLERLKQEWEADRTPLEPIPIPPLPY